MCGEQRSSELLISGAEYVRLIYQFLKITTYQMTTYLSISTIQIYSDDDSRRFRNKCD